MSKLNLQPINPKNKLHVSAYEELIPNVFSSVAIEGYRWSKDVITAHELSHGIDNFPILSWFLRDGSCIRGFCSLSLTSPFIDGAAHIYNYATLSSQQRKGYGSFMLQAMLDMLGYNEVTMCIQPCNTPSQKLAEKFGFIKKSEVMDGLNGRWDVWYLDMGEKHVINA